jgi:hypothetical protein
MNELQILAAVMAEARREPWEHEADAILARIILQALQVEAPVTCLFHDWEPTAHGWACSRCAVAAPTCHACGPVWGGHVCSEAA